MSNGEVRKISLQDLQQVQNLIETSLQLYMSKSKAVDILSQQAKIEPVFTQLVWQRLEEENQEFFRAYHTSLNLKDQITRYNEFLERQVELMRQACQTGVTSISLPNVSQTHLMDKNSGYQVPRPALPNGYINGASILQSSMQAPANLPGHAGRIDVAGNMLVARDSNSEIVQGMNRGVMIKPGSGYAGDSHFMFGAENNLTEPRNAFGGEASVSLFAVGESSTQALNDSNMDPEMGSFGFQGQIPRNFSLSDLTIDYYSNSTSSSLSDLTADYYSNSSSSFEGSVLEIQMNPSQGPYWIHSVLVYSTHQPRKEKLMLLLQMHFEVL